MNKSLINIKYLAVLLLAIIFLVLVSFDAFSHSEIGLGGTSDTATRTTSNNIPKLENSLSGSIVIND